MAKNRPKRNATRKQRPANVRSSKVKKRKIPTEADFEARIDAVVQGVFPTLSSTDISHQKCFRIRLGHKIHEISGGAKAWAGGHSDVVLSKNDKPLSLLELKRDDLPLTDADRGQALSYARLMHPWPPLTILSNGKETLVFETFTGNEWHPTTRDEQSIVELFEQSAKIADGDIRHAVKTLLGPGSAIWTRLVREITAAALVGLTGPWEDLLLPFPEELILPRKAAACLAHCIATTAHVPVIVGPPLSGKSNVLREFALRGVASPDYAVLFVDADS